MVSHGLFGRLVTAILGMSNRTPLLPPYSSTSYGAYGSTPRPPGSQPPPYGPTRAYPSCGCQGTHTHRCQRDSSSPLSNLITMACLCIFFVFLIILAQAVAFFFFYDLPTKLDTYSKAVGQMREQQDGMKREARHLESERHLLESERHSLEHEEEALKKERERWEKALEDRVPQGAFWDGVWPALDCRAYGKREYWGVLQNIPDDWTDLDACMNMPVKIKGVSVRRPDRCAYVEGSPHIHGFWIVDWGQLDCQPWLKDFEDKGCTNQGSGTRRIEAWVMQIKDIPEQDWHLLCESMPLTYNHVTYKRPTYCDTRPIGRKVAIWDISDPSC